MSPKLQGSKPLPSSFQSELLYDQTISVGCFVPSFAGLSPYFAYTPLVRKGLVLALFNT